MSIDIKYMSAEDLQTVAYKESEKIDELYANLGKAYFNTFSDNPLPELKDFVLKIKQGLDKKAEIDSKLEELSKKIACPKCGKIIFASSVFCSYCGEKLVKNDTADTVTPQDIELKNEFELPKAPSEEEKVDIEQPTAPIDEPITESEQPTSSTKKCNRCGKELPLSAKFCTGCGIKFETIEQSKPINTNAPVQNNVILDKTQMQSNTNEKPETPVQPTPTTKKCPRCGKELPITAKFCNGCGCRLDVQEQSKQFSVNPPMQGNINEKPPVPIIKKCARCGKELPQTAKFCTGCGNKFESSEQSKPIGAGVQVQNQMPTFIKCTRCGKELPQTAKFCTGCGYRTSM